jgi:AraC-like DNA-binding protein
VTEAAMEVGYSSLSHFSKAFCTTIGCCPALFPSATALVAKFKAGQRNRAL